MASPLLHSSTAAQRGTDGQAVRRREALAMVSTRKKARVSYAEVPSDDEVDVPDSSDAAGKPSTHAESVLLDSEATVTPAAPAAPEHTPLTLPAFVKPVPVPHNCSKALTLPLDLLCMILGHLPPDTLWAVSITSKRFNSILTSKHFRSVWCASFSNHKVYFSDALVTQSHYGFTTTCHGPFRFHAMTALTGQSHSHQHDTDESSSDDASNANAAAEQVRWDPDRATPDGLSKSDALILEKQHLLPLAIPACPVDKPDFAYARFLFVPICNVCGSYSESRDDFLWEVQRRMCRSCRLRNGSTVKELLTLKQRDCTTSDQIVDLIQYTSFILQENYISLSQKPDLPSLFFRFILHEGHAKLEARYLSFQADKAKMSDQAYADLLKSRTSTIIKLRKFGRELQEYRHLRDRYDRQVENELNQLQVALSLERQRQLLTELEEATSISHDDLQRLCNMRMFYDRFYYMTDIPTIDSIKAAELRSELTMLVEDFKRWKSCNPTATNRHLAQTIRSKYMIAVSVQHGWLKTPQISEADFYFVLQGLLRKKPLSENAAQPDAESINVWVTTNLADLQNKTRMRSVLIREDLYGKLTWLHGRAGAAPLVNVTAEAHTIDDDGDGEDVLEAEQEAAEIMKVLQLPEARFECTECGYLCKWTDVYQHSHFSFDEGHLKYEDFSLGRGKTWCKPIGYQSDRVIAPPQLGVIAEKLALAVERFKASDETRYGALSLPTTHTEAALRGKYALMFECKQPRSWGRGRKSYQQILEALYSYTKVFNVNPSTIAVESIRVYYGK